MTVHQKLNEAGNEIVFAGIYGAVEYDLDTAVYLGVSGMSTNAAPTGIDWLLAAHLGEVIG